MFAVSHTIFCNENMEEWRHHGNNEIAVFYKVLPFFIICNINGDRGGKGVVIGFGFYQAFICISDGNMPVIFCGIFNEVFYENRSGFAGAEEENVFQFVNFRQGREKVANLNIVSG